MMARLLWTPRWELLKPSDEAVVEAGATAGLEFWDADEAAMVPDELLGEAEEIDELVVAASVLVAAAEDEAAAALAAEATDGSIEVASVKREYPTEIRTSSGLPAEDWAIPWATSSEVVTSTKCDSLAIMVTL
jgi:hypothetical protein